MRIREGTRHILGFFIRLATFLPTLALFSCSHLFYYPDRSLHFLPDKLGFEAREIRFSSRDGVELVGWNFPPQGKPGVDLGTIVLFHGNAENISSHFLNLAWASKEGYRVFIFDYRGYGKSTDIDPDQRGTYLDGLAALERAWKLFEDGGKHGKFVVYGQSLGGAIAMRSLADFERRSEVALVVMDSTFVSYREVVRRKLASHWLTWVFSPLGQLLVSNEYSAEDSLRSNRSPLLVIHDENDPAVPFGCGERIFELASEPKEFWKLQDGRHIAVFAEDRPGNRRRFLEILEAPPSGRRKKPCLSFNFRYLHIS